MQVIIASMPEGALETSNFSVESSPAPELEAGQVLCRTKAITIGAGQRAGLQGSASYAGAPKVGDKAAWEPRMGQGMDALVSAALKGKGAMPAKGGNAGLSDADIKSAVEYMLEKSGMTPG